MRNMRTIVETLAAHAPRSQDPDTLTAQVRVALGRSIVQKINGLQDELAVMTLNPELEQMLQTYQQSNPGDGAGRASSRDWSNACTVRWRTARDARRRQGETPVLLVDPALRSWFARLARHSVPNLNVLAFNEVPDDKHDSHGRHGRRQIDAATA